MMAIIIWLSELGDDPSLVPALASDFRQRYGLSLDEVGEAYTFTEACYYLVALAGDSSSLYGSKRAGLAIPISFTDIILMDTWDLLRSVNSKKKPTKKDLYPRPMDKKDKKKNHKSKVEEKRKTLTPERKEELINRFTGGKHLEHLE